MPTYQIKKQRNNLIFSKLEEDKDTIELIFPLVRPSEVSALLDGDDKPSGLLLVGAINRLLQYPYQVANAGMPTNWLQNDEQSIDIHNTYPEFRLRDFDGAFTQLKKLNKLLASIIRNAIASLGTKKVVVLGNQTSTMELQKAPMFSLYQYLNLAVQLNRKPIDSQQPDLMAALNELSAPSSLVRAAGNYMISFFIAPSRLKTVVDRLRADLEKLNVLEHQPEVKV